jgi:hypothetical protein
MLSEGAYPIVAENLGGRWLALVFVSIEMIYALNIREYDAIIAMT